MKIKKIGHCCLVIETNGLRILTDPGNFSTAQEEEKDINIVLITHEHADHLHLDSLKKVLANNPATRIITNKGVSQILSKEGIKFELVEDRQEVTVGGVIIKGYGDKHALIHQEWKDVQNTGYFIDNKLFYPGDSLYNPNQPVDILALPVAGPWIKISEAIDYVLEVKPKICFPIHDGMLKTKGAAHRVPEGVLNTHGIKFMVIDEGQEIEL